MIRFGSLELKSNLFLSPLAGYTNLPFRLALREVGGLDLATTDLVNARSLIEENPKAFKLIETGKAVIWTEVDFAKILVSIYQKISQIRIGLNSRKGNQRVYFPGDSVLSGIGG